ncbi:MAG TPA: peptidyl-prolyl cis-trans isomerase [Chryseolinea sp.]
MKRGNSTFCSNCGQNNGIEGFRWPAGPVFVFIVIFLSGCDLIKMKVSNAEGDADRPAAARANGSYLYRDELVGFVAPGTPAVDSTQLVEAYIDSWIRKQLLIQEASRKIDINEAQVERKILDYRYSIIAYEYQTYYIKQHLDTAVSYDEIEKYYKANIDNFILKQNIVQGTFVKVPKNAPRTGKIKDLIFSTREKDENELKSYCLSFSVAYHISGSNWIAFDDLVKNSPLVEIPNKIQFLKSNPYFETSDENYLYFLRVRHYRILDNISPLEFVMDDIKNIILNKRKVELAKKLEDEVYKYALDQNEFEIFN